jgi:hypothetical protein
MLRLIVIVALLFVASTTFAQQRDSIRSIDFANFRYHGSIGLFPTAEYPTKSFTLRHGKSGDWRKGMTFEKVVFGDITRDGIEEAIVRLSVNTDGSAAVDHVYIFTMRRNKPTFLWGFEGGDRAWGGLRHAYAEKGELVIELFGRGSRIGRELGPTESVGLCCPRSFTRARYRWHNGRFRRRGTLEILPNPLASSTCPTCLSAS